LTLNCLFAILVAHTETQNKRTTKNKIKMRTKTLLLSAAALVAGIATSQAQVYSQNVVGYATLTLSPGNIQMMSPALDVDGTGTNGTIQSVLGTNCAIGTTLYVFNGTGYDILIYKAVGHPAVDEWTLGGVADTTYPLNVGEGFWILDPSDTSVTVVGDVLQGTLTNGYVASSGNISIVSDQVPLSGGLTSVLGYTPTIGDTAYLYDLASSGYDIYIYKAVGHPAVDEWTLGGVSNEPQISVGQGFWLQPAAATPSWNQTFTVN
jgi:hypothetical protein